MKKMEITKEIFEAILAMFKEQAENEVTYKRLNTLLSSDAEINMKVEIGKDPNKTSFVLKIEQGSGDELEE